MRICRLVSCPEKALDHLLEGSRGFVPASDFERDLRLEACTLKQEMRSVGDLELMWGRVDDLRHRFSKAVFVMPERTCYPLRPE